MYNNLSSLSATNKEAFLPMKTLKKLIAAALTGCMIFSMCACHGKDEIALTINKTPIKSALYLNALIECDSEARQRVDENLAADTSSTTETSEETDYFSQTIDGLSYVDYVESKTLERCKEYVLYQEMVDAGTLTLTDEEKTEAESYADYYWNYYGINTTYEANGVSLDTYKKAFIYSYYSNAYFMSLYGKDGEKAVDSETITNTLTEKFALVYTLSTSYTDETTDDEKATAKTLFNDYVSRLEKGEDFKNIYNEYYGVTEDEETASTESTASETTESTDEASTDTAETEEATPTAKDQYATIIGDEDTDYANDNFETVFEMKTGEVKLIEGEDNSGYTLFVKLDITNDDYYLTNLTESILYILKQEEFDKLVLEKTADFTVDENTYATNRFKVKKIVYPEATN